MPQTVKNKAAERQRQENELMTAFYERRHPAYLSMIDHWNFLESSYNGGRSWFETNIFKYFKEGPLEYKDRLKRAFRFNHTREVVQLVQKYLFKATVTRNREQAPEAVKKFWSTTSLRGFDVDQLMRTVAATSSIGGRIAVVVDNNFPADTGRKVSKSDTARAGYKIYAYVVRAQDVLDYAWDEDGDGGLLWIMLRENFRDDADPINSSGLETTRVRLWTRDEWHLFQQRTFLENGQSKTVVEKIDGDTHGLGVVPVHLHDHTMTDDPYRVPGLIDEVAYLDRAVANYASNLDCIINDQTFSQLAIPAQGLQQGDDMYSKVHEMGTKRIFTYDGGAGSSAKPEFLSPDPKQAGVILTTINKIINEIYHTIGLAGERTKEDNAVGIDNSSGVAKAYDFERVNSLLLSKAESCEQTENWMVDMVCLWSGLPPPAEPLVSYPTTFDVMRLIDDLVTAEALAKMQAPIELRRQQMRTTSEKMFPQLNDESRLKINSSIDEWLEGTDVLLPPLSAQPGQDKSTAAPSRQGSVTADTTDKNASQ